MSNSRRNFLKSTGAGLIAGMLPISLVRLSFAQSSQDFTFGYISDAHIQQIKGNKFVRNWDQGLKRAVAEANLLDPRPDFFMFGGDLAQLGSKAELDHGADILGALRGKNYMVVGEHDYYYDLGDYWRRLYGDEYYSFDHKGVHFVVLNSVLTYDDWNNKWETPMRRMQEMALLDNPNGSPFMVGKRQMEWLKKDLAKQDRNTPVVVFSHSPLQKIFRNWNFWTEEADEIQKLLAPFKQSNVIYGHVHQIQYNQIGNIAFNSVMSTAWPWPYPSTYAQAESHLPILTVPMNRADPFDERDATGWQFMNIHSGRVDTSFNLYGNENRELAWNDKRGHLADTRYQEKQDRIPPQTQY
ncbi:metallophosphoesterase family protein [Microbulbifer hainanensis]|uniref:metallophosphoesterase family protein n=1 Tax=Microbulbifer hainanensis TaxID=2735675 RepID=UPI001D017245|nr:metallophosphoesterase [Microbulbifer hainanensis]